MLRKPLGLLGIFLIVVGIGYFVGAGVAYSKVQGGYGALQSFSEVQNVELSYNDDGELVDRGDVEGGLAIRSLLEDDWGFPIVKSDLDPGDPLVNTATEYMYQMATISYHRSEEHTSELQSPCNLVCRLLLEKKKKRCRKQ